MAKLDLDFGVPAGPNARLADDLDAGFHKIQDSVNIIYDAYGNGSGGLEPFPPGLTPTGVTPGTYVTPSISVNEFGQLTGASGQTSVPQAVVYAGPSTGPDALPDFRILVDTDIPDLLQSTSVVAVSLFERAASTPQFIDFGLTTKNLSALRQVTGPANRAQMSLLGFTNDGDGGGGEWFWDAAATDADNTGTVILPTGHVGNGRWKRVVATPIDVRWFGCATADADNTAAMQLALDNGTDFVVPPGDFTIGTVTVPSNSTLDLQGRLVANLGAGLAGRVQTARGPFNVTATVTGAVPNMPVGTTVFAGDFSAYNPGEWIIVQVQTPSAAGGNEIGRDFAKVVAANGSQITIDTATRWAYPTWKISKISGITQIAGTLQKDVTNTIAGSGFLALGIAAGDLIVIENINGTDTYWGQSGDPPPLTAPLNTNFAKAYYELAVVKAITDTTIELMDQVSYDYTDFYIVKSAQTRNVTIKNGFIENLFVDYFSDVVVENVDARLISTTNGVGIRHTSPKLDNNGIDARVLGYSFVKRAQIIQPAVRGAKAATDNGNFKFLSMVDAEITDLISYDSTTTDAVQGIYPLIGDMFSTPYSSWNQNVSLKGAVLSRQKGSNATSMFIIGTRDCKFDHVTAKSSVRITKSSRPIWTNSYARSMSLEQLPWGSTFAQSQARFWNLIDTTDFTGIALEATGSAQPNSNRCFWIRGTCVRTTLIGYVCSSITAADVAVYIQNATGTKLFNSHDTSSAITTSVQFGSSQGDVLMAGCTWLNPVATLPASEAVFDLRGTLSLPNAAWNTQRLILGTSNLFLDDDGEISYKKNANPANGLDGNKLITRAVRAGGPIGVVTPAYAGQLLIDTTNSRVYIAYGTANTQWDLVLRVLTGVVTPIGAVTPWQVGQIYVDTAASRVYVAYGAANTAWTPVPMALVGSKTFDWPSVAPAASSTTTVTVTGAVLGDMVTASMSLDLQAMMMTAYVSAADTVTVVLFNPTIGAIDLASGTLSARIVRT